MRERKRLRSKTFLIELLFMTLFFAFISSVTLRLFVQAYRLREETRDLTFANAHLQSMAEYIKGSENKKDLEALLAQEGAIKKEENYIILYEKDKYEMVLKLSEKKRGIGKMLHGKLTVYKRDKGEYKAVDSLTIQKYYKGESIRK